MEEKLTDKISSVLEYIIGKPNEEITLDDYTILMNEVKEIRFRKSQEESKGRMAQLLATAFPANDYGFAKVE